MYVEGLYLVGEMSKSPCNDFFSYLLLVPPPTLLNSTNAQ